MKRLPLRNLAFLLYFVLLFSVTLSAPALADTGKPDATDAVSGLMAKFEDYPLVAIGEFHGLQQLGDLYISLIRQPEFARKVRNIVFEYGNSHYQDVIDRYINGEEVPFEELQRVWTPTYAYGPSPVAQMYIEFYRAVREVNATLPADQRLRVWLGDPALNPAQPATTPPNRDEHFASLLIERILKQGEKALVIIGAYHLVPTGFPFALPGQPGGPIIIGGPAGTPAPGTPNQGVPSQGALPLPADLGKNVRQIVEAAYPGSVYVVTVALPLTDTACAQEFEALAASWRVPSLITLAGTELAELLNRDACRDATARLLPPTYQPAWADGLLYLGNADQLTMSPFKAGDTLIKYTDWVTQELGKVPGPRLP